MVNGVVTENIVFLGQVYTCKIKQQYREIRGIYLFKELDTVNTGIFTTFTFGQ